MASPTRAFPSYFLYELPRRAGKAWSAEEDARLIQGAEAGVPLRDLAREHQRTPAGIRYRLLAHARDAIRRGVPLAEVVRRFGVAPDEVEENKENAPAPKPPRDGLDTMVADIRRMLRVIVGNDNDNGAP